MDEAQEAKTVWDVMPNFSSLWRPNQNYGSIIVIDDITATFSPYTTKRSRVTETRYKAIVTGCDIRLQDEFVTRADAEDWCEQWLRHIYKHQQLQKQAECYSGWLKYYSEEFHKLQAKVNEQEWQEAYARIKAGIATSGEQEVKQPLQIDK